MDELEPVLSEGSPQQNSNDLLNSQLGIELTEQSLMINDLSEDLNIALAAPSGSILLEPESVPTDVGTEVLQGVVPTDVGTVKLQEFLPGKIVTDLEQEVVPTDVGTEVLGVVVPTDVGTEVLLEVVPTDVGTEVLGVVVPTDVGTEVLLEVVPTDVGTESGSVSGSVPTDVGTEVLGEEVPTTTVNTDLDIGSLLSGLSGLGLGLNLVSEDVLLESSLLGVKEEKTKSKDKEPFSESEVSSLLQGRSLGRSEFREPKPLREGITDYWDQCVEFTGPP